MCALVSRAQSRDLNRNMPLMGEFQCIAQQVGDDLANPARIAHYFFSRIRGVAQDQVEPFFLRRQQLEVGNIFGDLSQVEWNRFDFQFARLDLGKIENIVDQPQQAFGAAARHFRIFFLLRFELAVHQQAEHADHTVHRRANFVAHIGEKFAFRLAGRFGLGARRCQLQIGFAHLAPHLAVIAAKQRKPEQRDGDRE